MDLRPKTIICDIDGVIFKHKGDICNQHLAPPELLKGVQNAFRTWDKKGYKIILVTGRRENTRHETEQQLVQSGIIFDHLIMGIGGGSRVLINDRKIENAVDTAIAYTLNRNDGLESIIDI